MHNMDKPKKTLKDRIEQGKMIISAITSDVPEGQSWYEERLAKCETCEYNSDNVAEEKRATIHTIHEKKCQVASLGKYKRFCTACTCCIDMKCGQPRAICGKADLGLEPLWLPIKVELEDGTGFSIIKHGTTTYEVGEENGFLIIDMGETNQPMVSLDFVVFAPMQYNFLLAKPNCGCTVATTEQVEPYKTKISLKISTENFSTENVVSKLVILEYTGKSVPVKIKIKKTV